MNLDFTGSTLFLVLLLFAVGLICIIKGGDLFVDAESPDSLPWLRPPSFVFMDLVH